MLMGREVHFYFSKCIYSVIKSDDNNDIFHMEEASSELLPAIPFLDFGLTLVFSLDENCSLKLCLVYRVR